MIQFALGEKEEHNESGKPWYDTKDGIKAALTTLEGFMKLVSERHNAGYNRSERMNEFYVLGRFSMDTCGNCGKISGWIPKKEIPEIPDVLTRDEFWEYIKEHAKDPEHTSFSCGTSSDLPFNGVICPICNKGWTIDNCHDIVVFHKTENFSLAEFVGKTLGEVQKAYLSKKDATYQTQDDILVRNDRFIDLAPRYPGEPEEWKQGCVKNKTGWVSKKDGIDGDYVIQEGDEGFFNIWTHYHSKCNRLSLAFKEEAYFRDIFKKAGFNFPVLHHLPNGYCPCDVCAPWFKVETEIGTITLGWRKRVINIDWSEVPTNGKNISRLFSKEEVTKGPTCIHAWGTDKAVEYLGKIRAALTA